MFSIRSVGTRFQVLPGTHLCPSLSNRASCSRLQYRASSNSHSPRSPCSNRLEGKTCMVTGASSGIGLAIADRFLREGAAKTVLVGRSRSRLEDAVKQFGQAHHADENLEESSSTTSPRKDETIQKISELGPSFSLVTGDVGVPSFWCHDIQKLMTSVDILVNAAGVSHSALIPLAKDEHISQILNTNLQGTILACRAMAKRALRHRRQKKGETSNGINDTKCIINISSLHAMKGGVGAATYASTKAGVIAFTRALVAESNLAASAANLRANVIVPGYIETKMLDDLSEQFREEKKLSIPLRRFGTCEEVSDAAVFLATNQYANNCILNLDGGLSAT